METKLKQYHRILVELSGDSNSEFALAQAKKLAIVYPEADFYLLLSPQHRDVIVGQLNSKAYDLLESNARAQALKYAEELEEQTKQTELQAVFIVKPVQGVSELVAFAQEHLIDLIVVNGEGSFEKWGRWIRGNRALKLVRESHIDLIVAPRRKYSELEQETKKISRLQDPEITADDLEKAYPPYRERRDEILFVQNRLAQSGSKSAVLGPITPTLNLAFSEALLKISEVSSAEDVQELDRLDSVFLPWHSLDAFGDSESVFELAACGFRSLRNGGIIVCDLFNPWLALPVESSDLRHQSRDTITAELPDGRNIRRQVRVSHRDFLRQTQNIEFDYWILDDDGRLRYFHKTRSSRFFGRYEFQHLLKRAGFEIEGVFGSHRPGDLAIVGRKPS